MDETTKKIILNVDDNNASRYATGLLLGREGFEVIEATTGTEALQQVKAHPDLILLDVNLPDLSGFEVCRRIKDDPATSWIPVLHLSATYLDDQSKVKGLEGGAEGYLTQPVEPRVLVAYVKALLRMRAAEKEAWVAVQQWKATFNAMRDGVALLDLGGTVLRCNRAMADILRKPLDEILGHPCWELVHGTSEPIAGYPMVRMRETGHRATVDLPMGDRWYTVTVDPLMDEDGHPIGGVHVLSDITERVQTEKVLRRSAALNQVRISVYAMREASDMQNVLVSMYGAMKDSGVEFDRCSVQLVHEGEATFTSYSIDRDGVEVTVSKRSLRDSAVCKAFRDRQPVYRRDLHAEDPYGDRRNIRRQGVRSVLDVPFSHGTLAINSIQPDAFSGSDIETLEQCAGVLSEAYTRFEDIRRIEESQQKLKEYSERLEDLVEERTQGLREAQEQLVRKEKLAMIGQLAGGVGHELRNPLSAIKSAAYFLNMVLEDPDPDVKEMLGILEKEVGTSERIITSLLDFARHKPPTRREVKVNDVLLEALSRLTLPDPIEVMTQLDESLPVVLADPDQLLQVFGNLLLNAVQAMPEGGQLTVTSQRLGDLPGRPDPAGRREWVAVSVSDTGVGISEEEQGKIFEALYTTKARGIGLGLALTKMLVESHGGTIEVHSAVGEGSIFTVSLPVH